MYRLLIVDDEELIRKGLRRMVELNSKGFYVVGEATNGKEGYEQALKLDPNLIIVDIEMPKMDGLEMIDNIREIRSECNFIILSAHTNYDYMRRAIKSDVVDYLKKPINRLEFWNLLDKVCTELDSKKGQNNNKQICDCYSDCTSENTSKIVQIAKEYINNHYFEDISLEKVADYINMNPNYFSTLFKNQTGKNFIDYLTILRIEKSKELLNDLNLKIYQISEMIGYYSPKHFSNIFKKYTGVTPSEYRKGLI